MGGACDGAIIVQQFFDAHCYDRCQECMLLEEDTEDGYTLRCQVLDGRESTLQCPALQEHIEFNEIKLYGPTRRACG